MFMYRHIVIRMHIHHMLCLVVVSESLTAPFIPDLVPPWPFQLNHCNVSHTKLLYHCPLALALLDSIGKKSNSLSSEVTWIVYFLLQTEFTAAQVNMTSAPLAASLARATGLWQGLK